MLLAFTIYDILYYYTVAYFPNNKAFGPCNYTLFVVVEVKYERGGENSIFFFFLYSPRPMPINHLLGRKYVRKWFKGTCGVVQKQNQRGHINYTFVAARTPVRYFNTYFPDAFRIYVYNNNCIHFSYLVTVKIRIIGKQKKIFF